MYYMKLPDIKTRHKIRDAKICKLWVQDLKTTKKIGELFKITSRRINTILFKNKEFLEFNADWHKKKRIRNLLKWIDKAKKPEANKLTLQNELRTELEGVTPLIDQSKHQTFIIEIKTDDKNNRSPVTLKTEDSLGRITKE